MLQSVFATIANSGLERHVGAQLIIKMCAWAKISADLKNGLNSSTPLDDFYDLSFELTATRWKDITDQLCSVRSTYGDDWAFESIDEKPNLWPPGAIETIRQALISAFDMSLTPDALWNEISDYMFEALEGRGNFRPRNEIVDVISNVVSPSPDDNVYCAYNTSAASAVNLSRNCNVFFQAQDKELGALISLFGIASGRCLNVRIGDPLTGIDDTSNGDQKSVTKWPASFDHVISFPPFGQKIADKRSSQSMGGSQSVEALQADHVLPRGNNWRIAVVSEGVLFRASSNDLENRIRLINHPDFHSVTSLPRGSFGSTTGVATAMIAFRKFNSEKHGVAFIDGRSVPVGFGSDRNPNSKIIRQEWADQITQSILDPNPSSICWIADKIELEENDFNLTPSRYVVDQEVRVLRERVQLGLTLKLEDVAEIFKVQAVPSTLDGEAAGEVFEVSLSDLNDAIVSKPNAKIDVTESTLRKIKKSFLQEGDILLSIKGTVGKVGLVPKIDGEQWVPSQSFVVIRLRRVGDNLDPVTLVTYLRSWLGQEMLTGLAGGTTVPMLPMGDLRNLPVPRVTQAVQERIHLHLAQIDELKSKRDQLNLQIVGIEKQVLSDLFKFE